MFVLFTETTVSCSELAMAIFDVWYATLIKTDFALPHSNIVTRLSFDLTDTYAKALVGKRKERPGACTVIGISPAPTKN